VLQWAVDSWKFKRAAHAAVRAAVDSLQTPADQILLGRSCAISGSRDVVLMPCWRRPEMLWHCLDNLVRADGIEELHVVFRPDYGYDPDNIAVIRSFADRLRSYEIRPALACPYRRTRLSANILLGYLYSASIARNHVYLIEEDIMVGRDFFHWHHAVQSQRPDLFCSIAVRNHNRQVTLPDDPDGYYLSSGDYCSWGVCFRRRVITDLIVPHVNLPYLSKPKRYLRRQFAQSQVGLGYVEQAGLIRRIQEMSGRKIAYPAAPRAFHGGFYGRNRPGGVAGHLDERVQQLARMIYNPTAMRHAALTEQYAHDSEPVPLDICADAQLHQLSV
jgi:hypothetical protein